MSPVPLAYLSYNIVLSLSTFADCRSQFLPDRLERCLKLIVSHLGTSSHEFASQFGLELFYTRKNYKNTVSARSLTVSATTVRTAQQERQFIPSRQVALLTSLIIHTNVTETQWMILLALQNPTLRESYPSYNGPAKRGNVCESFEKRLIRYRYRPLLA